MSEPRVCQPPFIAAVGVDDVESERPPGRRALTKAICRPSGDQRRARGRPPDYGSLDAPDPSRRRGRTRPRCRGERSRTRSSGRRGTRPAGWHARNRRSRLSGSAALAAAAGGDEVERPVLPLPRAGAVEGDRRFRRRGDCGGPGRRPLRRALRACGSVEDGEDADSGKDGGPDQRGKHQSAAACPPTRFLDQRLDERVEFVAGGQDCSDGAAVVGRRPSQMPTHDCASITSTMISVKVNKNRPNRPLRTGRRRDPPSNRRPRSQAGRTPPPSEGPRRGTRRQHQHRSTPRLRLLRDEGLSSSDATRHLVAHPDAARRPTAKNSHLPDGLSTRRTGQDHRAGGRPQARAERSRPLPDQSARHRCASSRSADESAGELCSRWLSVAKTAEPASAPLHGLRRPGVEPVPLSLESALPATAEIASSSTGRSASTCRRRVR